MKKNVVSQDHVRIYRLDNYVSDELKPFETAGRTIATNMQNELISVNFDNEAIYRQPIKFPNETRVTVKRAFLASVNERQEFSTDWFVKSTYLRPGTPILLPYTTEINGGPNRLSTVTGRTGMDSQDFLKIASTLSNDRCYYESKVNAILDEFKAEKTKVYSDPIISREVQDRINDALVSFQTKMYFIGLNNLTAMTQEKIDQPKGPVERGIWEVIELIGSKARLQGIDHRKRIDALHVPQTLEQLAFPNLSQI